MTILHIFCNPSVTDIESAEHHVTTIAPVSAELQQRYRVFADDLRRWFPTQEDILNRKLREPCYWEMSFDGSTDRHVLTLHSIGASMDSEFIAAVAHLAIKHGMQLYVGGVQVLFRKDRMIIFAHPAYRVRQLPDGHDIEAQFIDQQFDAKKIEADFYAEFFSRFGSEGWQMAAFPHDGWSGAMRVVGNIRQWVMFRASQRSNQCYRSISYRFEVIDLEQQLQAAGQALILELATSVARNFGFQVQVSDQFKGLFNHPGLFEKVGGLSSQQRLQEWISAFMTWFAEVGQPTYDEVCDLKALSYLLDRPRVRLATAASAVRFVAFWQLVIAWQAPSAELNDWILMMNAYITRHAGDKSSSSLPILEGLRILIPYMADQRGLTLAPWNETALRKRSQNESNLVRNRTKTLPDIPYPGT